MSNSIMNRRKFLGRTVLGAGALVSLPGFAGDLFAQKAGKPAGKGSRIVSLEELLFKRDEKSDVRRVLKINSSSGAAGYADMPDLDYVPSFGGVAKAFLIGANPYAVEDIWAKMRAAKVICSQRTALDYALWDLLGRETGKPVYELLGGPVRDKIRIYYYGASLFSSTKGSIEERYRAVGKSMSKMPGAVIKFDPLLNYFGDSEKKGIPGWESGTRSGGGKMPTEDMIAYNEMVFRCLREGGGDGVDLIHGSHGQCCVEGAIAICKRLEKYNLLWFEEPLAPTASMDDFARVARATTVPLATGENLGGLEDFQRLMDKRAVSVLNLPPANVGGLTEARKIAAIADTHGMQIAPHFFGYGPLCWAAMANLCMATRNVLILEANNVREKDGATFFKEPMKTNGNYFVPSGKPGLGYEYDEQWVVKREQLA